MPATVSLFDDEFLKKLEYLSILSKRLFAGQLKAERRAMRRGTGLEFADYRQYVAGEAGSPCGSKSMRRLCDRGRNWTENSTGVESSVTPDQRGVRAGAGRRAAVQSSRKRALTSCPSGSRKALASASALASRRAIDGRWSTETSTMAVV